MRQTDVYYKLFLQMCVAKKHEICGKLFVCLIIWVLIFILVFHYFGQCQLQ